MSLLEKIDVYNFTLECGIKKPHVPLFYQLFGQPIGSAPVVIVNHALTGNSAVCGEGGWWNDLVGENKTIDTDYLTVISFNIPGNGYDGHFENLILNYTEITIRDVAQLFWHGLFTLNIKTVFAVIGGSLGGAVAWEMAAIHPTKIEHLIPIATDWKATDWVLANVLIQDQILNNSDNPIVDARLHAMLLYRTPQSINLRFQRKKTDNTSAYQIENWLLNHGLKLKNRFCLPAYKLMNHLLKTNDITRARNNLDTIAAKISSAIYIISVDSDYFFTADENVETYQNLKKLNKNVFYSSIKSIHGHDAFLIEFQQLISILTPIFTTKKHQNYVSY